MLAGNMCVGLDLDTPARVEEFLDDDHSRSRPRDGEEPAVDAANGLPVFGASEKHARAVDVLDRGTGTLECRSDDRKALLGLCGHIGIICTYRPSAGDMDLAADAHSTRESNDGFVGRGAGDVCALRHERSPV